jgi:hypothetical protein
MTLSSLLAFNSIAGSLGAELVESNEGITKLGSVIILMGRECSLSRTIWRAVDIIPSSALSTIAARSRLPAWMTRLIWHSAKLRQNWASRRENNKGWVRRYIEITAGDISKPQQAIYQNHSRI